MADPPVRARVRLERLPAPSWGVIAVVILSLFYAIFEVSLVRPYLWPAGTGAVIVSDPASQIPLIARPPDVRAHLGQPVIVKDVASGSPAAARGITPGTEIVAIGAPGGTVDVRASTRRTLEAELDVWRAQYWLGCRGPPRGTRAS